MSDISAQEVIGGVIVTIKVVPGSSRTCIAGSLGGMLKVKVAAPPEKGKANQCLIDFLANQLGIRKNCISITSGLTSAVKQLRISNMTIEQFSQKLNLKK